MPRKPRRELDGELFAAPVAQSELGGPPPSPPAVVLASPEPTAKPTPSQPLAIAIREALGMSPAWLAQLPLVTTLWLRTRDGVELVVTNGRDTHGALRGAKVPVITLRELDVLAGGAENHRGSSETLGRWLASGGGAGKGRPVADVAYGALQAPETPNQRWLLGKVLDAWGLELTAIAVGDGPALEVLGAP